jgi:hypothetical protein
MGVIMIAALVGLFLGVHAFADEPSITMEEARRQGFKVVTYSLSEPGKIFEKLPAHAVDWPFEHFYSQASIGNNFAQFQPYDVPGYHAGADMILEEDSWVLAPIDGKLEAGHYSYTNFENGSRIKHWLEWPKQGSVTYFELAVLDPDGNRYELHHIDRESLPPHLVDCLNKNNCRVSKGERMGRVFRWSTPFHYDHVHANVVTPAGHDLNPEYIYKLLPDSIPPQVRLMIEYQDGHTKWFVDGETLNSNAKAIVVYGNDSKDNNVYRQAAVLSELEFTSGQRRVWDFTYSHFSENGDFQDIREVYPVSVRNPDGGVIRRPGGYYPVNDLKFVMRLRIPQESSGEFFVRVKDMAGNSTTFTGRK